MQKVIRYGVVGFSSNAFDKVEARKILTTCYKNIEAKHADTDIQIVSGYTKSGVPEIAYELADDFGFTTIGFSAEQALTVKSGVYPVNKKVIIGKKFGDESEDFIHYIDHLIRVGGGKQSRHEVALFKEWHGEKADNLVQEFEVDWFGKF